MNLTLPYETDVAAFADSIRRHVAARTSEDTWHPGAACTDHSPGLIAELTDAGLYELTDACDEMRGFIGVAGYELGAAAAPYSAITAFLGAGLSTDRLALYGGTDQTVVSLGPDDTVISREVVASHPVAFIDSLGMHLVDSFGPSTVYRGGAALGAWRRATIGYLGGLSATALDLALEHARAREAFGGTLADIEAVQHKLAEAAVAAETLRLSAVQGPGGADDLVFAGEAAAKAAANTHQILGAMGFTVEFSLQRYTRRIRSLASLTGHVGTVTEAAT